MIFAAAAVMVAVFFTFALSGPLPPKEMGIILGVAVLLDAVLIRLLLLPVLLRLMGRRAWYLPRWARRVLPDVRFGHVMTMRLRRRIPSIKPTHAADRFFSGKISLVDVRSDRERMAVRVPGAAHIPLLQLHRRIDEIRTDRPVALLCRSGHRSALAARIARRHGLDSMSVTGGMRAWLTAELPVVWPCDFAPELHEQGEPHAPGDSSARTSWNRSNTGG